MEELDNFWNEHVSAIAEIVAEDRKRFFELGEHLHVLAERYSGGRLTKDIYEPVLQAIKETEGEDMSYSKLRQAKTVYEKVQKYNIPPDIPYYAILKITGHQEVDKWIGMIHNGISYVEVLKEIKALQGKKEKTLQCPNCGQTISV